MPLSLDEGNPNSRHLNRVSLSGHALGTKIRAFAETEPKDARQSRIRGSSFYASIIKDCPKLVKVEQLLQQHKGANILILSHFPEVVLVLERVSSSFT